MSTFRILPNTPLKFSRVEDSRNQLQNEQNTPDRNYKYFNRLYQFITASFDNSEPLFFQVRTDYTDFTIYLKGFDLSSTTLVKSLVNTISISDVDYNTYQVDVPITGKTGYYYIYIEAIQPLKPILTFESEPFMLEQNSKKLKLSWFGSDSLNDIFVWGNDQACIRLEGHIKNKVQGEDRSTYIDTFGNVENTYALPQNNRELIIRNIPEYLMTILELAISHDEFYVNDVKYGASGAWEYEPKANRTYSPKLKITQKDYLNYSSDEELTGEIPVFDEVLRTTGLEDRTTGVTERKTNN